MNYSSTNMILQALGGMPEAYAKVKGSDKYPEITGEVYFFQVNGGTAVLAEIHGLPIEQDFCKDPVFGFHIHSGFECIGNAQDPFADSGMHYNPRNCEHPHHAGDLPPLFGNRGFAWMMFFTDRFMAREVIGKTVIIHRNPDDFKTQPSGNSGEKIACGMIR